MSLGGLLEIGCQSVVVLHIVVHDEKGLDGQGVLQWADSVAWPTLCPIRSTFFY